MENLQTATFANGCFWCTEAIFKRLKGVFEVTSGYSGGKVENPTYEQVCTGITGHAEAIQIQFDPTIISYTTLLRIFFATHDPTTLNRQGNDIGTQYRSAIFYHSEEQKEQALDLKSELEKEKIYDGSIVTEILPFVAFYKAEEYHKNYYDRNKNAPYCRLIIDPKVRKLLKMFEKNVKEEYASR